VTTPDGVADLVKRWAAAEERNDAGLLEGLLAAGCLLTFTSARCRLPPGRARPRDSRPGHRHTDN
jgi:hypothetical protein